MTQQFSAELDLANLAGVRQRYWRRGGVIPFEEQVATHLDLYDVIDLDARADLWRASDKLVATEVLESACQLAHPEMATENCDAPSLLVIGVGTGRNVEHYLATANKIGIKRVAFNDLHEFHIVATQAKVERLGALAEGLEIAYSVGDFCALPELECFDVILSSFFVTAEVVDCSSVDANRAVRDALFRNVCTHLKPGGVFLEDTPDCDTPGFYRTLRINSANVLGADSILATEFGNIVLSHVETAKGPRGLVRYIPDRGAHLAEMHRAGFETVLSIGLWGDPAHDDPAFPHRKWVDLWTRSSAALRTSLDCCASVGRRSLHSQDRELLGRSAVSPLLKIASRLQRAAP